MGDFWGVMSALARDRTVLVLCREYPGGEVAVGTDESERQRQGRGDA